MPQQLDREGTFRAQITDYCLMAPFKSGAIPLSITVQLTEMWDADAGQDGEWVPWAEYEMQADGLQWLVKKDGSLNESTVQNLIDHAGWDGDFDSFTGRTWQPTPCQVVINEETNPERAQYNQFPIAFVNAYDATPGGKREMSPEAVAALKTQHGAALRALAGNAKRNAATPKGKPPKPPAVEKDAPREDPVNAAMQEAANEGKDNIPF